MNLFDLHCGGAESARTMRSVPVVTKSGMNISQRIHRWSELVNLARFAGLTSRSLSSIWRIARRGFFPLTVFRAIRKSALRREPLGLGIRQGQNARVCGLPCNGFLRNSKGSATFAQYAADQKRNPSSVEVRRGCWLSIMTMQPEKCANCFAFDATRRFTSLRKTEMTGEKRLFVIS
jgi:hypothetical protein